ncbi:hypothetical protein [Saccharopolyspora pogona]|uniref:hypothetical protein n=1 Tax=Saccharopolyspora pogona TaxID=333966 RepID=UPI001687B056|nr:hypothetical protein [Saccharopolyspora pogona]
MIEIEHRPSDSPYIERVWSSSGASAATRMHSIAYANWELVVWEDRGPVHVAARGPEISPSSMQDGSAIVNDSVAQPAGAVVAGLYVVDAADINARDRVGREAPHRPLRQRRRAPLGRIGRLKRGRPGAGRSW